MTPSSKLVAFALGLTGLALPFGTSTAARADCTQMAVVSYGGGAYQKSHVSAFITPFSTYRGIPVRSYVWDANYGTLKSMVDSGAVDWDVVDIPATEFARARDEGLLQTIKPPVPQSGFQLGTAQQQGVGNVYWATVLAYKRSTFPKTPPRSWADFFDTKRYPGARAMYDDPRPNIEFALLADGVGLKSLYPLTQAKIDRAFKKLDSIKPSVKVWWGDGSQPVQLLLNDVVVMSPAWSGRIFASPIASKSLGYTWNGAALELDYWVIPKGSHCLDSASRFIAFASTPAALAQQTNIIAYGPANRDALSFVSSRVKPHLPTYPDNFSRAFVVNADNWRSVEDAVRARWTRWKNMH